MNTKYIKVLIRKISKGIKVIRYFLYITIIKIKVMNKDKYGVKWDLPENELCPDCGQPDSCGDCNHSPLTQEEIEILGGINL